MKSDTTIYAGRRLEDPPDTVAQLSVTVNGHELPPARSQKARNHSPDGFNWGYAGSGPAQLALGILIDFTGSAALALAHYQDFKFDHVARWDQDKFEITGAQIREWLAGRGVGVPAAAALEDTAVLPAEG